MSRSCLKLHVYSDTDEGVFDIALTGSIRNISKLVLENTLNEFADSADEGITEFFTFEGFENLTGLSIFDIKAETKTPPFAQISELSEVYYRSLSGVRYVASWDGIQKHKESLTLLYTDKFSGYSSFNSFDTFCRELINLTDITVNVRRLNSLFYSDSSGKTFDAIENIDLSINSLTAMPLIGYSLDESYTSLETFSVEGNKIASIENLAEAEFEGFFGNSNTKVYDFRNNNITLASIDLLLKYAYDYVAGTLTLKLEGYNSIGSNAVPTNDVTIAVINSGGTGYAVDDTFEDSASGAVLTVTSVSSGVITAIEITTAGSGVSTAISSWTETTAGGSGADIDGHSYYTKLNEDGHLITTN